MADATTNAGEPGVSASAGRVQIPTPRSLLEGLYEEKLQAGMLCLTVFEQSETLAGARNEAGPEIGAAIKRVKTEEARNEVLDDILFGVPFLLCLFAGPYASALVPLWYLSEKSYVDLIAVLAAAAAALLVGPMVIVRVIPLPKVGWILAFLIIFSMALAGLGSALIAAPLAIFATSVQYVGQRQETRTSYAGLVGFLSTVILIVTPFAAVHHWFSAGHPRLIFN
jgi:hypothetical protein